MKNSILILLLGVLPALMYSQSYTEKYNSLYNRYELYDSSNNLVSYKKYNSLYNRWEYYEVAKTVPTYQGLKPSDPTNWDLAYQALAYKQQKYDEGNRYVTSQIQKLRNNISNSTTLSSDEKTRLQNSITNSINKINSTGKSDFSNSDVVNSILNYIYQNYNNTINSINESREHEQTSSSTQSFNTETDYRFSSTMRKNFNTTLKVKSIKVYNLNGDFVREEHIQDYSYITLNEKEIEFKKADGIVAFRNLVFKNSYDDLYKYSSDWGDVIIDSNLNRVRFYDKDLFYEYSIGFKF